jgi:hypothetical protein
VTLAPTGMAVLDGIVVRTPAGKRRGRSWRGSRGADRLRAAAGAAPEEAVGLALFATGPDRARLRAGLDRPRLAGVAHARAHRCCLRDRDRRPRPRAGGTRDAAPRGATGASRRGRALRLLGPRLFLPAAGSWDVDFWRTAILNGSAHGYTRTYGGPDDVPAGHLRAQLTGKEPVSLPSMVGRPIVVNYPPLTITMWTLWWRLAERWGARLESIERRPWPSRCRPVAGDSSPWPCSSGSTGAVRGGAATLAALYWATPVSWLSGAVLGYQDGAYAPRGRDRAGHRRRRPRVLGGRGARRGHDDQAAGDPARARGRGRAHRGHGPRRRREDAWPPPPPADSPRSRSAFSPFAVAGTLPAAVVHVNNSWLPGPTSGDHRTSGGWPGT